MVDLRSNCEACRREAAAEAIESDVSDEPYRLCRACGERLKLRALRPLEWFNLAAIHGWWKFLLHDDFYDQDGMAGQPETNDYSIDGMIAPTLDEASETLDRLIDYCMTRWRLGQMEFDAIRAYGSDAILGQLEKRAQDGNRQIFATSLHLCANVLGHEAAA